MTSCDKRSEDPNENETDTTRDALSARVRRFVVFRRYEAIETWFVEAPSADMARERVFPDDPEVHPHFEMYGGADPTDSAVVRELHLVAHEVRRFPANVTVFYDSPGAERTAGPRGEPARRHTS